MRDRILYETKKLESMLKNPGQWSVLIREVNKILTSCSKYIQNTYHCSKTAKNKEFLFEEEFLKKLVNQVELDRTPAFIDQYNGSSNRLVKRPRLA